MKLLEKPVEPPKKGNFYLVIFIYSRVINIVFDAVSMNKIRVGNAPPPKLREVKSKIGSLQNATHKPGGGNVKIESKKLEFNVQSRIAAKNDAYAPRGGDKKVIIIKLYPYLLIITVIHIESINLTNQLLFFFFTDLFSDYKY